jgi:hypothetical protein
MNKPHEILMKLVEELPIYTYHPGNHEDSMRLLHWWMELASSGEILDLVFPDTTTLAPFMGMFQTGRCRLAFSLDENDRIQAAIWGEPIAPGIGFVSFWARKAMRHTKEGVAFTIKAYKLAFELLDAVQGVTKQDALLQVHKKLGYKVLGKFPKLWGGVEPAYLVMLTKEDFYSSMNI